MLLSPGIESKETSLQTTVVNSATGRAATVGKFRWGPAFEISQIVGEVDLVDRFYTPDDDTADSFFSGANFLKYGNDLRLVRIVDEKKAKNASAMFDVITCTIATAGSGYAVGDTIAIKYKSSVLAGATGTVTGVTAQGGISKYFINNKDIVAKLKEIGEYPVMSADWTIEVNSASGGSSASLTTPKLNNTSGIYFPNDDSAFDALVAPTSSTAGAPTSFKDMCEMMFMPTIAARFPGEFGSDFEVEIASYKDYTEKNGSVSMKMYPTGTIRTTNFRSVIQYGPQTPDQFALIVRRGADVLEAVVLSTKAGERDIYGNNIYVNDYFSNGNSRYITGCDAVWPSEFSGVLVFGGGFSGNKIEVGQEEQASGAWMKGWDLFADRYQTQVNLLIAGSCAGEGKKVASTVQKYVSDLATERQDCLVFISPPRELLVNVGTSTGVDNLIEWRRGTSQSGASVEDNMNINTTYATIDGNYKYYYDKYNDVNRWMPLAADIAGLCARTDAVGQPWMSPAGFSRGQIQGVIKLAIETRQAHRDRLYQDAINPVVSFAGQGVILYGDKTATSQPSPFDRINVRRLFNLVKTSIGNSAQYKIFELNDAFTQMSFRSECNAYLDTIRSLGGMYDFRVVCDQSNNTSGVIDRNEFVATILIKPARSINFITLNYVATSTGADFDEIVGKI